MAVSGSRPSCCLPHFDGQVTSATSSKSPATMGSRNCSRGFCATPESVDSAVTRLLPSVAVVSPVGKDQRKLNQQNPDSNCSRTTHRHDRNRRSAACKSSSVSTPGPGRIDGTPTLIFIPRLKARSCSSCSQISSGDCSAATIF